MKSQRSLILALTLLAPTALILSAGCSKSTDTKVGDVAQDATAAVKDAATDIKDNTAATWSRIKDYTYDKRAEFSAGIDSSTKKMDDTLADLKSKATADTPEKSKARQEYDEARAELKVKLADLGNTTTATWSDAKAQVSKAWDKVEASYEKLTN